MDSSFTWVDFGERDRDRVCEVIQLFEERDTRDELGIGAVRDAIADRLFPGTSTLQTRARYFLFVPWIYVRHESRRTPAVSIAKKARRDEISLVPVLLRSRESEGTIGARARASLERLPSSVYWAGLAVWGIRTFRGSQTEYHRRFDALTHRPHLALDDDEEPVGLEQYTWDPGLPPVPNGFPHRASFRLTRPEAEYLAACIRGVGPTLLRHLIEHGRSFDRADMPWLHPRRDSFPADLLGPIEHARNFSEVLEGAAILYNWMLARKKARRTLVSEYRDELLEWARSMEKARHRLASWDREGFWALVTSDEIAPGIPKPSTLPRQRVSLPTRRFVDSWIDVAVRSPSRALRSDAVQVLISDRERYLKGSRARLENPRALDRWNEGAGLGAIDYRWRRVQRILRDVHVGLGR